jgi:hypothetical protein
MRCLPLDSFFLWRAELLLFIVMLTIMLMLLLGLIKLDNLDNFAAQEIRFWIWLCGLVWGGFGLCPGEELLPSSSLLTWLLLALEIITFPAEVQVADGLPLGTAPPRRIQELMPVAGLIILPDLLNQGHKICFRVISGPPFIRNSLTTASTRCCSRPRRGSSY